MSSLIVILCILWSYNVIWLISRVIYGHNPTTSYLGKYLGRSNTNLSRKIKRRSYSISSKDYIKYSLPIAAVVFTVLFIFLRNPLIAFLCSLLGFYYPRYKIIVDTQKRKELLNYQFKELLFSISNSLKAGASLQSAIERSLIDLKQIYKNHIEKPIVDELELLVYDIKIGKSLEEGLMSFQNRVNLEDVTSFTNAAIITEKTGGNLTEVMSNVAGIIGDKIQIKREIRTLTAAKRSEARILTIMPIILVLVLSVMSPEYMKPMYETVLGKFFMVLGLILIGMNYFIGKRIINIDV